MVIQAEVCDSPHLGVLVFSRVGVPALLLVDHIVDVTSCHLHPPPVRRCTFFAVDTGVNFTNILRAAFSYESFLCSFYVLTMWVCNFWQKDFGTKAAHKMLVNLTPGERAIKLEFFSRQVFQGLSTFVSWAMRCSKLHHLARLLHPALLSNFDELAKDKYSKFFVSPSVTKQSLVLKH